MIGVAGDASTEEYKKINMALIFFSLSGFVIGTYTYYYPFFESFGWTNLFFEQFALGIYNSFYQGWIIKVLILIISSTGILTFVSKNVVGADSKKVAGAFGTIGIVLYLMVLVAEQFFDIKTWIAFSLHSFAFLFAFFSLIVWRMRVAEDLKKDRRKLTESQFDQSRELKETENSVNLKYGYSYLGEERTSNINILQPYRGSLIGGVPGSGKSFAIIEAYMRQHIKKGFTGVVYDFKFPTLSVKTYNYFKWYESLYKVKPSFYVINFDDPEYSHRCNPISVDTLNTVADAEENTKVLMLNINKTWLEKEGDFFTDSANQFSAMLLWYLKLATEKYDFNVCTFPHLVALASFGSTELLFFILLKYDELKSKMKSFAEAMDKDAGEQLAGQVASATTALAKVSSKELDYIMTGDDFDFQLNDPLAPKVLCVGNNPDRQIVYSPSIGLILTKLSKTMNKLGQERSFFIIDEFPTVYVRGVDTLIATGRSNRIAPTLGFQTFAQITADYGKETADKIVRDCGNRLMGQLFDEDAELVSKTIGKQKVLNRSINYSTSDISENHQTAMEEIVPPERIAQFSQGTFCGVIADEFINKENNKVFYGDVVPALELKKHEEDMKIPKIREFISKDEKKKKTTNYLKENQQFLELFITKVISLTPIEWINKIESLTTKSKLDNYLINTFNLEENTLKEFTKFIRFKESFKTWINIQEKKCKKQNEKEEDFLNTVISKETFSNAIKNWIQEGFSFEAKETFLTNHSKSIKEDIYRLIAMEFVNLGVLETFITATDSYYNKHKRTAIRIFSNIIKEQEFTDDYTENLYTDIINKLKEE